MQSQRKKLKIYREEVKERQTTHWDLDYMTSAEFESAMVSRRGGKSSGSTSANGKATPAARLIERLTRLLRGKQA